MDHTNTYPDLVNVEDWLNAKGYTGEAGACHQAMSLIRSQEKRIAELEAEQERLGLFSVKIGTRIYFVCEDVANRIAELESLLRQTNEGYAECIAAREDYRARIAELEAALSDTTVHLVAAVSLLERGGKKAAPSNKMFEQMLVDYKNSVERARAAMEKKDG